MPQTNKNRAELAVMYPVNGAFYTYICRFIDPSWGFAIGWDYGIQWLTILPFELSAACNIIHFWDAEYKYNVGIWVAVVSCHLLRRGRRRY